MREDDARSTKIHEDLKRNLSEVNNVIARLRELGDDAWVDDFKKEQEKRMKQGSV